MCELSCMKQFLWMVDAAAVKASSLNHCNKADPSQSSDSSDVNMSWFYTALRSVPQHRGRTTDVSKDDLLLMIIK